MLSSLTSNLNGTLIAKIWLKDLLMLLEIRSLSLLQLHMKKRGTIGLKTFKTGVYQDNFGGVIESQFTLLQFQVLLIIQIKTIMNIMYVEEMLKKQNKKLPKDSKLMFQRFKLIKMKMYWIHGFHQDYSLSQQWDGQMLKLRI